MAGDATGENRTIKTVVAELIPGGERPASHFRVIGQRRLKKIVRPAHDSPPAVRSRSDDPFELLRFSKNFCALRAGSVLALVKIAIADIKLEMAVKFGIEDVHRRRQFLKQRWCDLGHRACHVGSRKGLIDASMTLSADLGANECPIGPLIVVTDGSSWWHMHLQKDIQHND